LHQPQSATRSADGSNGTGEAGALSLDFMVDEGRINLFQKCRHGGDSG
jgi:hypothetical protein